MKTRIAGEVGNRDVLVFVQTWNPQSPETEATIRAIVEQVIEAHKSK